MTFPEEREAVTEILGTFPDPCVIMDLGAHEGEDTKWMLEVLRYKHPRSIMVEADVTNYKAIGLSNQYWATCLWAAISDHVGTCDFWECRDSGGGYGSIYRPLQGLSVTPQQFTKAGQVPCFTLDHLFAEECLASIDLLWVDIHGAEKDMITHGQEALKHTHYLMMEVFNQPLYEGMATKAELLTMLPGWTVLKEFPWNVLLRNENFR